MPTGKIIFKDHTLGLNPKNDMASEKLSMKKLKYLKNPRKHRFRTIDNKNQLFLQYLEWYILWEIEKSRAIEKSSKNKKRQSKQAKNKKLATNKNRFCCFRLLIKMFQYIKKTVEKKSPKPIELNNISLI